MLLVDDDRSILSTLRRLLELEGYEVLTAETGGEALQRVDNGVDLVVLDLNLPGIDGVEVCRRIRYTSTIPVLMLTARDQVEDRVAGLDAGADDYLVKPFAAEELLARIRALLRRVGGDGVQTVVRVSDLSIDSESRIVKRGDREIDLTVREYDLLLFLAENSRKVLTRSAIMNEVWGYDVDVGSNTLEVYVGYLRKKLEADGEARLVHTVRGVGYVLRD
ncbi:MAG: response regulator transcription factor [Acidimicrobiia bacterium]|nr:response regulator transcription factor [Acidimicrobiia bacterium]